MARLTRKPVIGGVKGLTIYQRGYLKSGVDYPERTFESAEAWRAAWFANRDQLIAQVIAERGPFTRPAAYWEIEVDYVPNCLRNGYESERAALLRLGLRLTRAEEALLKGDPEGREIVLRTCAQSGPNDEAAAQGERVA